MSRVFSTASPITSQAGDNVTFSIEFEDYAGNKGVLVNSTTDNTTVTYDDQNPILSPIKIIVVLFNTSSFILSVSLPNSVSIDSIIAR